MIRLHDQALALRFPARFESDVEILFGTWRSEPSEGASRLTVQQDKTGFSIRLPSGEVVPSLTAEDVLNGLTEATSRALTNHLGSAVALHSGAVGGKDGCLLIPGASGAGKTSLTAWFVDKGFDYLTDEVVVLPHGADAVLGLPRALVLKPGSAAVVSSLPSFQNARSRRAGDNFMLRPPDDRIGHNARPCRLMIFPAFEAGATLSLTPLNPAQAALRLMGQNANARNLDDGGFAAITALTRRAPAVVLRYGGFDQLDGVADVLAKRVLEGTIEAGQAGGDAASIGSDAI